MDIKKLVLTGSIAMFAGGLYAQVPQQEQQQQQPQQQEQQQQQQQQQQQNEDTPQAVKDQFNQEFASAKDVEWERDGQNYEAEFEINDKEQEVIYNERGEKEMSLTEIEREQLPRSVTQTLENDYQDYDLDDFARVEKGGQTFYEVEAEKKDKIKKLKFDSEGNKIKDYKSKSKKS